MSSLPNAKEVQAQLDAHILAFKGELKQAEQVCACQHASGSNEHHTAGDQGQTASANTADVVVAARVRPLLPFEIEAGDVGAITTHSPGITCHTTRSGINIRTKKPKLRISDHTSRLHHVFCPRCDNKRVFDVLVDPLISHVLDGGVATVFAYGQTGAGKTHTVMGMERHIGAALFSKQSPHHQDHSGASVLEITLSVFELLGDYATDLLHDVSLTASTITTTASGEGDDSAVHDSKEVDSTGGVVATEAEQAGGDGASAPDAWNTGSEVFIREDVLGKVQVQNVTSHVVPSPAKLHCLIDAALSHRRTFATTKNDTSSRSHAICRLTVTNTALPAAEPGVLFLVDLAGSERSSDSKHHDADRIKETKLINTSLLTLKECIRARTKAALGSKQHVHVNYRASRLTLLLKESFELKHAKRPVKMVVLACVSPRLQDASHSHNTLRYAVPIKVALRKSQVTKADPRDPGNWDHDKLVEWIMKTSGGLIDPAVLCPTESGAQLVRMPEGEFLRRCLLCTGVTEKRAKEYYLKLWGKVADSRARRHKAKLRLGGHKQRAREVRLEQERYAAELLRRELEGEV